MAVEKQERTNLVATVRILYICTANQCRSPFAEATLQREAGSRPLEVSSAGLMSGSREVRPHGIAVGRERGLDLSAHRSRQLTEVDIDGFDLILTMERRHSREIVAEHPELAARVFTVKQFDRWAADHRRPRRAALRPWLELHGSRRPMRELLGDSEKDTVADPYNSAAPAWRQMADLFDAHAVRLIAWLEGC